MKHLLLIFACCFALRADPVTYTYTETVNTPVGDCYYGCPAIDFTFPQFDPLVGTLDSVTWTFTDYMSYYGGFSDIGSDPGLPFSYTTTEGDQSAVLGLDAANTQAHAGTTCGCRQISLGGFWNTTEIVASGTAPDSNPFIGTGTVDVSAQPFLSSMVVDGQVYTAMVMGSDAATLTVSYVDAPVGEVPEPSYGYLIALAGGLVWIVKRRIGVGAIEDCSPFEVKAMLEAARRDARTQ